MPSFLLEGSLATPVPYVGTSGDVPKVRTTLAANTASLASTGEDNWRDPQFFVELDSQLGETRGDNGEPSSTDYLLIELPSIADMFATSFDDLPAMYEDRKDYRYLVTTGALVTAAVVVGRLHADGSIIPG
jgi:hypothetical protein